MVAHATAIVIGVQYVDLKNVTRDKEMLLNLPQDVATRSMVVPVGEIKGTLVVAMIDVTISPKPPITEGAAHIAAVTRPFASVKRTNSATLSLAVRFAVPALPPGSITPSSPSYTTSLICISHTHCIP